MTDVPAVGAAPSRAETVKEDTPRDVRPLASVAPCTDLPAREEPGPAEEADLPAGHVLDERFFIREVAGRSGMATIYRARDQLTGGDVAVKVPHLRVESDPVSYGRFQREQRIGEALSDPFLLRFVPAGVQKSRPYIVTEFLDGCTLALVIHRTRPMEERDALKIASAICQALAPMHAKRLIHRDLKPGNIMICRDGRLCIMDFGLASEIETTQGILAGLNGIFGTPEYMAPEQVRNRSNDERTDIYAVGVILFQMLTGVLPFQHEDAWEVGHMRANGDPVAPRTLNPAISPQVEEIVLHAMRRKPAERYPSVAAFQAELDAPERVHVTGLCQRLKAPRWRLSFYGTPILSGFLIGIGALVFMVGLFFALLHFK
jgi:serine/threonine-protein kinase